MQVYGTNSDTVLHGDLSPVVAPLHHGARLEVVAPQLVDVGGVPQLHLGPEAELQVELALPSPEQRPQVLRSTAAPQSAGHRTFMISV